MSALVLHVRLHDGRYHGEGDWPPSPARLFQALVAGVGVSGPLGDAERSALTWLENQSPPIIAVPPAWRPRRGVHFYMPNNDGDSIGGDPLRMSQIRTAVKVFRPYFFDPNVPFVYAWPLSAAADKHSRAPEICSLAERVYQFGRGVDLAWAWGEMFDDGQLYELLASHPGRVFRPSAANSTTVLPSPTPGSLDSIERRHRACAERFRYVTEGRSRKVVFRNPPRARFRPAAYDCPSSLELYELRDASREAAFAPWRLPTVSALIVRLRDGAVERLKRAMPGRSAEVDRLLVGRRPDGTNDGQPEDRVRIIPLPSIGHVHADGEIRRVLVDVPSTCSLRGTDVHWAFSGLDVVDPETGEITVVVTRSDDQSFLRHYGVAGDRGHRLWRTTTPAVLPEGARRRRIDPVRGRDEAKAGRELAGERTQAAAAVRQALRHAGVRPAVETIRVQRQPFDANGARVEAFAGGTRFTKERLWHVEVAFDAPVPGPLVIGDGRFVGLGVMAPVAKAVGVHVLEIEQGLGTEHSPENIARALRRAVMARVQTRLDRETLPTFFSGHDADGTPARAAGSSHLTFTCDLARSRLVIIAPHALDRREPTAEERHHLAVLDEALAALTEVRTGAAGCLQLRHAWIDGELDPLMAPSRTWQTVTPYVVTRHVRMGNAAQALRTNLIAECRRLGLPAPVDCIALDLKGVGGVGLTGHARLEFSTVVRGPVLLGRNRYLGGGLFAATGAHG